MTALQSVTILGKNYDINNTTNIDLSGKNLTQFPHEIFRLTNLKSLIISYNKITEIPDKIINFQQLKFLYIRNNQITTISENLLRLPALRMIMLYKNPLTNINMHFLKRLNQQHLYPSYIYITINDDCILANQKIFNRVINIYERPQRVNTRMARCVSGKKRLPNEISFYIEKYLHDPIINVPRIKENFNNFAYRTVYSQLQKQKLYGKNIISLNPKNIKHLINRNRKHNKT